MQFDHNIAKVIAASGFDTPKEQWQYSIKRYIGIFYPIIKPFNSRFINLNCTFVLMDEENHNGHYDYFLTDAALEYAAENPTSPIDKELYIEHDEDVMNMIIEFFDN